METPSVLFNDTLEQMRLVNHERQELIRKKTLGTRIRTRKNWSMYAGKPTKYFLNLEKRNYIRKTIISIQKVDNTIISSQCSVLKEIRKYYDDLYASKGESNMDYVDKLTIPKISEELKLELDKNITLEELDLALKDEK